ncbi:MAG: DUF1328 domain-containing protein [Saprospiraceae bacterium]
MFRLAFLFLLVALAAGVLGFGGLVIGSLAILAKVVFFVAIVLFIIGLMKGKKGNNG